jgi:ubiquinone/menaquinone biosynthesis C-methylase UbiE
MSERNKLQKTRDIWRQAWESEALSKSYGDLFFARATGELAEMESSKAAARRIARIARAGDSLLDAGCGAGHYYRSLKSHVPVSLQYTGVDATPYYIECARRAFAEDGAARFVIGDIFDLDFADRAFDLAMCNNVLLHLPSIMKPLSELCRVARRHVLVRTLVANKSYVVQDVNPGVDGADFDDDGKPIGFHYLTIYGEAYIRRLLAENPRVRDVRVEFDRDFSAESVADTGRAMPGAWDATQVVHGMQHTGPIMLPWHWITVELAPA